MMCTSLERVSEIISPTLSEREGGSSVFYQTESKFVDKIYVNLSRCESSVRNVTYMMFCAFTIPPLYATFWFVFSLNADSEPLLK